MACDCFFQGRGAGADLPRQGLDRIGLLKIAGRYEQGLRIARARMNQADPIDGVTGAVVGLPSKPR